MNQIYTVSKEEAGARLDQWLCKKLAGNSRKQVKRYLDAGRIYVNGKQVFIAGWQLKPNDQVELAEKRKEAPGKRYVKVLFEDRDIIVVDKPAGVLSLPQKGSSKDSMLDSVQAYLRKRYAAAKGSFLYPLHRLDTETSGAMVFAKSKAARQLEGLFKTHKIERRYLGIVCGAVSRSFGRIDEPLKKGVFSGGKKTRVARRGEGKTAVTEYAVKERYPAATLLELNVRTGRTHQIRVHLAHMGHPLVGDKLYGSRLPFPRQALHAHVLGFLHPATKRKMRFVSPLPKDLKDLVDGLRSGNF